MFVGHVEIGHDRSLELVGAAVNSAANLFLRELAKPALDQVDPRGTRRREMQLVAGVLQEPAMNRGRLVGSVVIEHHVDVEILGHRSIDGVGCCRIR